MIQWCVLRLLEPDKLGCLDQPAKPKVGPAKWMVLFVLDDALVATLCFTPLRYSQYCCVLAPHPSGFAARCQAAMLHRALAAPVSLEQTDRLHRLHRLHRLAKPEKAGLFLMQ